MGGGDLEASLSILFSFDSAQSHSIAYSSLQEGHRNPLNTPWFGVSPHLLCLVPCPCSVVGVSGTKTLKNRESPCPTVSSEAHRSLLQSRHRISSLSGMKPFPTSEVLQRAQLKQLWCQ